MFMRDILYGHIEVPDLLVPFLRIPEFVRLRGVRLSNVDSIQFKDLNGPTRWDHAIGVLHLAQICARSKRLDYGQTLHLSLAALLHDIATPPFAHTAEYVLSDFDHENETGSLLAGEMSQDVAPDATIYESEAAQFHQKCAQLSRQTGLRIDPDEIARMVIGEGELGYLIAGTLDLDNADNVTRATMSMGFRVDPALPERLASWLGTQDAAPIDLAQSDMKDVIAWLDYRKAMYGSFYNASAEERGREAYLQHLFRRALVAGVPRRQLVWNTDDGLLSLLSRFETAGDRHHISLSDLTRRYRLMETPRYVLGLKIQDPDEFRALRLAAATSWIERQLSTEFMEPIVSVAARRFSDPDEEMTLIPPEAGQSQLFVLGSEITYGVLPGWLKDKVRHKYSGQRLVARIKDVLSSEIEDWLKTKPWFQADTHRVSRVKERLEAMGDWSFRQSRNAGLHPYPATFVHAIPATMIHALGVAGDDILDCFGGTGQTAIEAVKTGGCGISADSNYFATLIAQARMAYLSLEAREFLRQVKADDIRDGELAPVPDIADLERWHDPRTIEELRAILGYISGSDDGLKVHMEVAFSAILPSTTARKGLQHGFFADNTPLARGKTAVPYVDAVALFLARLRQNIGLAETLYGSLERQGRTAGEELARARAVQVDARCGVPTDYGVEPGSLAAIITSPPYLCMTDYTLGNRLSYYWLAPERMAVDLAAEISPRRRRPGPSADAERVDSIVNAYITDISKFALSASSLLRSGGYLAIVLGMPVATAFEGRPVLDEVDRALADCGFEAVWSAWRSISWSRNHGYARLKRERLSVHRVGT